MRTELITTVREVQDYLRDELRRVDECLSGTGFDTILVGMSDQGSLSVNPCRLLLPFHYPATIKELDGELPPHFSFATEILENPGWQPTAAERNDTARNDAKRYLGNWAFQSYRDAPRLWSVREHPVSLFVELYEAAAKKDGMAFDEAANRQMETQLEVLRRACTELGPKRTMIGINSDSESCWEVNTIHLSGPPIPSPPPPTSDAQVLSRLCRHVHSYVGRSRFHIENDVITKVSFDGADTTDATIDLLRDIPNLGQLLRGLKLLSLQSTLLTERSLEFLRLQMPNMRIQWSAYSDD